MYVCTYYKHNNNKCICNKTWSPIKWKKVFEYTAKKDVWQMRWTSNAAVSWEKKLKSWKALSEMDVKLKVMF